MERKNNLDKLLYNDIIKVTFEVTKGGGNVIATNKLVGVMAEKGISGKMMAKRIGITPKTFYAKMKKGIFGLDEIEVIIDALKIEDPRPIFFAKKVT